MKVLTIDQKDEWETELGGAYQRDFYHTHTYHALAESRGEGIAHMWVYREGIYMIALPLLVRSLEDVNGFEESGRDWRDAVSVYGYAGPVASHRDIPEAVVKNFQMALAKSLQEHRIISVFSRLHPLIPSEGIIAGLGDRIFYGETIAIDLTLTPEEQWERFRTNHQRRIRKLRRSDYTFIHDVERKYLCEFVEIYTETMLRVGAEERYFFDDAYFRGLFDGVAQGAHLFLLTSGGTPVCGGVFIECDGIVEFHLGGTRTGELQLSPMKMMIDEARLWASSKCFRMLHLGGGRESLFHFKAGFSDRTYPFSTWQWVINSEVYETACQCKAAADARNGLHATSRDFFPRYRSIAEPAGKPPLSEGGDE